MESPSQNFGFESMPPGESYIQDTNGITMGNDPLPMDDFRIFTAGDGLGDLDPRAFDFLPNLGDFPDDGVSSLLPEHPAQLVQNHSGYGTMSEPTNASWNDNFMGQLDMTQPSAPRNQIGPTQLPGLIAGLDEVLEYTREGMVICKQCRREIKSEFDGCHHLSGIHPQSLSDILDPIVSRLDMASHQSPPSNQKGPTQSAGLNTQSKRQYEITLEGMFKCKECNREIKNRSDFWRHLSDVHRHRRGAICPKGCGKLFTRKDNAQRHGAHCGKQY